MSITTIRFYIPGGVLSPGELRRIVSAANYFGVENIHIGNRQDLILKIHRKDVESFKKRIENSMYYFTTDNEESANIVTSYSVRNIFNSTPWVTEGIYLEILSSFTRQPKLKINICDPLQSFVPLFSGNLNFIASHHDNYWFLFVKFPGKQNVEMWPVLVDGNEISALSFSIEEFLISQFSFNLIQLQTHIYNLRNWNFRIIDKNLTLKHVRFSNYEGFYPMGERFWLGVYHRENSFPVNFVENMCVLCLQTDIGGINITSWNTFLIKNMDEKDIPLWENLLGKHGINTGHSDLELNWHTSELDYKANKIKKYVVKAFEKRGLRTTGLVFGITSSMEDMPCSVIITRRSSFKLGKFDLFTSYGVRYKKDFDPNAMETTPLGEGLKRRNLPNLLAYLTALYYENAYKAIASQETKIFNFTPEKISRKNVKTVHQCKECLTVYDPVAGDESLAILPDTPFEALPPDYKCPVCEASREAFISVDNESLEVKSR